MVDKTSTFVQRIKSITRNPTFKNLKIVEKWPKAVNKTLTLYNHHLHIIFISLGLMLLLGYVLYNVTTWKEHYDFKYQDFLITQQKMDPKTQEIHDAITLEEW